MIVGVAYVENSTRRSSSKRSIDLISPIVPTWTRSSNGSPRLRKRRATCWTNGRCGATRPSRAASMAGSVDDTSWNCAKSTAFCSRASSPRCPASWSPEPPSTVISTAGSRSSVGQGEARVGGEGDLEMVVAGVRGRLGGEGAQHLPGEALVVRLGPPRGRDPHRHRQRAGSLPELGLEVAALLCLGEDER